MTKTNGVALTDAPKPGETDAPAPEEVDEVTADAGEPDGDAVEEDEAPARSVDNKRNWRPLYARIMAGTLAVAVLGGGGYAAWRGYQQHQREVASRDALHAAEKYAVVLTSIDTNAIDQNFTDVLDGATGEFKDMYSKSSTQLRQLLVDNKAAAHGTVLETAVQSVTPDEVVVLLFVDQSITNSAVPDPRIDRSRIKMTMDKVDGRWLAGKVELP